MFKKHSFGRLHFCGLLFFLTAQITGCTFNSEYQHPGAEYLQGVWVQDREPFHEELLQYTLHEFKFTCDSIYATLNQHSAVKNIPDSCYNDGEWTEYAKGVYVVRGDSLIVDGLYTKSNWKQKISGCYRSGQYLPRFKIVHYSSDSLVLQNRFDPRTIVLRKVSEITCVPKKRWE
jgi:hypothetical protein